MCKIWDGYYSVLNYNISQRIDYFNQQIKVENINMVKYKNILNEMFIFCRYLMNNIFWHSNMGLSLQDSLSTILSLTSRKGRNFNYRTKQISDLHYFLDVLNKFYKDYSKYIVEHFKCDRNDCLNNAIQYKFVF